MVRIVIKKGTKVIDEYYINPKFFRLMREIQNIKMKLREDLGYRVLNFYQSKSIFKAKVEINGKKETLEVIVEWS